MERRLLKGGAARKGGSGRGRTWSVELGGGWRHGGDGGGEDKIGAKGGDERCVREGERTDVNRVVFVFRSE